MIYETSGSTASTLQNSRIRLRSFSYTHLLVEIVACSGDGEVSVEVVYQTEMGGSILLFINQDISAIFRTVFPPEIIIDHEVIREDVYKRQGNNGY